MWPCGLLSVFLIRARGMGPVLYKDFDCVTIMSLLKDVLRSSYFCPLAILNADPEILSVQVLRCNVSIKKHNWDSQRTPIHLRILWTPHGLAPIPQRSRGRNSKPQAPLGYGNGSSWVVPARLYSYKEETNLDPLGFFTEDVWKLWVGTWTSKRAQNNGPISQNREYIGSILLTTLEVQVGTSNVGSTSSRGVGDVSSFASELRDDKLNQPLAWIQKPWGSK